MNQYYIVAVLLLAVWFGIGPEAAAQAPEEVALDAVRTRSSIPPDDPAISNWITYRIETLTVEIQVGAKGADDNFLQAFRTQYNHPENSASFNERFVEQTTGRFAEEFNKGRGLQAPVGLTLARALNDMKDLRTFTALSAGLKSTGQPAIRYACAKTFAALIPTIQADTDQTSRTLEVLREAGSAERNGVVLKHIYKALFYRGANLEAAVQAMLEVVKAQLRIREKDAPACDGAEEVACEFLRSEMNNISDKSPLVAVLAAYLRLDVQRYSVEGVSDQEKYFIEFSIDAAEGLLVRLVTPPAPAPNIREARKNENRDINMPLELNRWIGTTQTKGMLNDPPWNVPVGAPIPD